MNKTKANQTINRSRMNQIINEWADHCANSWMHTCIHIWMICSLYMLVNISLYTSVMNISLWIYHYEYIISCVSVCRRVFLPRSWARPAAARSVELLLPKAVNCRRSSRSLAASGRGTSTGLSTHTRTHPPHLHKCDPMWAKQTLAAIFASTITCSPPFLPNVNVVRF